METSGIRSIGVLLTCFNRKKKTLDCIDTLQKIVSDYNKGSDTLKTTVYLTDDGSSDGTAAAVIEKFPDTVVLNGSGNLFWANGMIKSWTRALEGNHDAFLLLNDDTELYDNVFDELMKAHEFCLSNYGKPGIYIGATENKKTKELTYSGALVTNYFIGTTKKVRPDGQTFQKCDYGNANIMLVPKEVVETIGILSEGYVHGKADYDYTMKAKKAGIPSLVCPNICGHCVFDHDHSYVGWENMSYAERKKSLYNPKGVDFSSQLKFNRKFFPFRYPFVWLSGYFKLLFFKTYLRRFEIKHKE